MAADTKGMREFMDATPGDRMAMDKRDLIALIQETPGQALPVDKNHIRSLLDAVDLGRIADGLAGMSQAVRGMAAAA